MTTKYRSSNTIVHLSKGDAAAIAALQRHAERCLDLGYKDMAWDDNIQAALIVNRATLKALSSGKCTSTVLMFGELPASYKQMQAKQCKRDIHLKLVLIEGSSLTQEILNALQKHMKGQNNE